RLDGRQPVIELLPRRIEIVGRLEVQPELGRAAQEAGEPQRRGSRDRPPPVEDVANGRLSHPRAFRETVRGHAERPQELFVQYLAGMNGSRSSSAAHRPPPNWLILPGRGGIVKQARRRGAL